MPDGDGGGDGRGELILLTYLAVLINICSMYIVQCMYMSTHVHRARTGASLWGQDLISKFIKLARDKCCTFVKCTIPPGISGTTKQGSAHLEADKISRDFIAGIKWKPADCAIKENNTRKEK